MIVQKELANNPFGHGDLHALPYPGLQQADTRPLSTNFYVGMFMQSKVIYQGQRSSEVFSVSKQGQKVKSSIMVEVK